MLSVFAPYAGAEAASTFCVHGRKEKAKRQFIADNIFRTQMPQKEIIKPTRKRTFVGSSLNIMDLSNSTKNQARKVCYRFYYAYILTRAMKKERKGK